MCRPAALARPPPTTPVHQSNTSKPAPGTDEWVLLRARKVHPANSDEDGNVRHEAAHV